MGNPYKKYNLKKFMDSISPEEFEKQNLLQERENERVYAQFKKALESNKCFLCGGVLDEFNEDCPCYHWFLYPKGIRKKHFKNYLNNNQVSFFRLDCYLRWMANSEKPIGNINDLYEERAPGQYFQTTIRFKNLEWVFSVGKTDKEGHENSSHGRFPHYHIQMKVDSRLFIKFNDFHIKFTDDDLFVLELAEQAPDTFVLGHDYGQGINILEDSGNLEKLDKIMTVTEDESRASFYTQTFIEAPEGKPISGELVVKVLQESQETEIPARHILKKYRPDCKIKVIIYPSDSVPAMVKRKGRGKKKSIYKK
jgi:hypothetical protein